MTRSIAGAARALSLALLGSISLAPLAAAQNAVITGVVTSDKGVTLQGANIYITDLKISVGTDVRGAYRIAVAADLVHGQTVQLRARAIGFLPQSEEVRLSPGSSTKDFTLQTDPNRPAEVVVGQPGNRRLAYSVVRGEPGAPAPATVQGGPAPSPSGMEGALERFLFPPELVMRFQQRINLTDAQRSTITREISQMQSEAVDVQWRMSDDTQKLMDLLQQSPVSETEVLATIDRITSAEAVVKKAQLTMLIRIRNTLTADQQSLLRSLRDGTAR